MQYRVENRAKIKLEHFLRGMYDDYHDPDYWPENDDDDWYYNVSSELVYKFDKNTLTRWAKLSWEAHYELIRIVCKL